MDSNRYGVLAVTVIAVLVAALAALITHNSWADKDTSRSSGLSVRLQNQTTTTFSALSTTSSLITTTTVALPLPTTSTSRGSATTPTSGATGTTASPTATTRPGTTPTTATTPTTRGPAGTFDQRSDNEASFRYGPNPQDRDSGTQGPTSSKGQMRYIVRGSATSESQWTLTAEVVNNSGREARFEGGIDAVLHLSCNGNPGTYHLHNPEVTTMPAGGGVQLGVDIARLDVGPGTCTLHGTVKYTV